jgi:DUF4097 and DUF4098 domain-containing protein YvlB
MFTTIIAGTLLSVAAVQQTDTVFSVQPGARLDIDTFGGEVVVRTWSSNEMRIQADHSSRTRVGISQSPSAVRVHPRSSRGVANVDFEITVPEGTSVEVNGTFVDATMDGQLGEVRVETVHGDIAVSGASEYVYLYSVQGNVELSDTEGAVDIHSVNGSLRMTNVTGRINADATNGRIILEGIRSSDVEATTVNGTVRYDGTIEDGGRYRLSTHSGDVTLAVAESINATVSVSTFSGHFDAGFPITLTRTATQQRRFNFTVGDGSARVDLESFSGNIRIEQR